MKQVLSIILFLSALLLVAAYFAWDRAPAPLTQPAAATQTRTYNIQNLKATANGEGAIAPAAELYAPTTAEALPSAPTAATGQKKLVKEQGTSAQKAPNNKPDCTISGYKYDTEQTVKGNMTNLKDAQFDCKIKVKNMP